MFQGLFRASNRRLEAAAMQRARTIMTRSRLRGGPKSDKPWEEMTLAEKLTSEDKYLVATTWAGALTVGLLYKLTSGSSSAEPTEEKAAPAPAESDASSAVGDGIPSMESPEFEKWLAKNENNAIELMMEKAFAEK